MTEMASEILEHLGQVHFLGSELVAYTSMGYPFGMEEDQSDLCANAEERKSFRPISLTFFMFKALENVVDFHMKEKILSDKPLHSNQFVSQKGKSTFSNTHTESIFNSA